MKAVLKIHLLANRQIKVISQILGWENILQGCLGEVVPPSRLHPGPLIKSHGENFLEGVFLVCH